MIKADRERLSVVSLIERVARLREHAAWPEGTRSVKACETHMAWVCRTDRDGGTLEKAERAAQVDCGSLGAPERGSHGGGGRDCA
ncbi:hypothetical protein NYA10_30320, partial [Burkholderia thailandensis]|nr:hypothetical protein [Burkholderia thailandensis]